MEVLWCAPVAESGVVDSYDRSFFKIDWPVAVITPPPIVCIENHEDLDVLFGVGLQGVQPLCFTHVLRLTFPVPYRINNEIDVSHGLDHG